MSTFTVTLAQLNLLVGDVAGNADKVIEFAHAARDQHGARLVVFPELTLTGYPPEDLLLRPDFLDACELAVARIAESLNGVAAVFGTPLRGEGGVFNGAMVVDGGRVVGRYHKHHLPNYGVFDDKRYFAAGDQACVVDLDGFRVGVTICEDIWRAGPARAAADAGAELLININASPFHVGKRLEREDAIRHRIAETGLPMVYVNMVGGQDEVVYDGASSVFDAEGRVVALGPAWDAGMFSVDFGRDGRGRVAAEAEPLADVPSDEADMYQALVMGVRDYVRKNGFGGVAIGLSGGMDSALVAAVAADALGPDNVHVVMMPTRYTSQSSLDDAKACAGNLGLRYDIVDIESIFPRFLDGLRPILGDGVYTGVTAENVQSRCRGTLLMGLSNATGKLVLATGNKSEMAMGYATLYGDMAGGFAPLKDVYKTWAYRLARYRNTLGEVIPENIFVKPPTAELRDNQKDEDSLPPYEVLDAILEAYVEHDRSEAEIIAQGYEAEVVRRTVRLLHINEYKRRQAPPGVKVTRRAFGRERRFPITSGYGK